MRWMSVAKYISLFLSLCQEILAVLGEVIIAPDEALADIAEEYKQKRIVFDPHYMGF